MKRILFVTGNLDRGGAQRVLGLLADYYCDMGVETHVAMLFNNKVGYIIHSQLILHDVSCQGNYFKNLFPMIQKLRNTINSINPDVIVSFAGRINMVTMLAKIGLSIPVILSERNDPANDRRSGPERLLCKLFYSKAEKVVFQTNYQASFYKKWCKNNGVIIGNPISAPVYEGEHPVKDIICVGKLMEQKNHPMMVDAFAMIANDFPETQVFIYGEGPEERNILNIIDSKGMKDRIHLCGNTDQMFEVMHKYQYFVMCSNYEGLSNALLEAMISGMTCITTNWNGADEVITDNVNGYLVPVDDSKALAEKMRIVLKTDNNNITRQAIKSANEFEMGNVFSKWNKVIEKVARSEANIP